MPSFAALSSKSTLLISSRAFTSLRIVSACILSRFCAGFSCSPAKIPLIYQQRSILMIHQMFLISQSLKNTPDKMLEWLVIKGFSHISCLLLRSQKRVFKDVMPFEKTQIQVLPNACGKCCLKSIASAMSSSSSTLAPFSSSSSSSSEGAACLHPKCLDMSSERERERACKLSLGAYSRRRHLQKNQNCYHCSAGRKACSYQEATFRGFECP